MTLRAKIWPAGQSFMVTYVLDLERPEDGGRRYTVLRMKCGISVKLFLKQRPLRKQKNTGMFGMFSTDMFSFLVFPKK